MRAFQFHSFFVRFVLITSYATVIWAASCQKNLDQTEIYRTRDNSKNVCLSCIKFLRNANKHKVCTCARKTTEKSVVFNQKYFDRYRCTFMRLIKVPVTLSELDRDKSWVNIQLNVLEISYNNITTIPNVFVQHFSELFKLVLTFNAISTISKGPLNGTKLQVLNLSHNRISVMTDPFFYLTDLFEVDLSFNQIKVINHGLFRNQRHLERVLLNNNEITLLTLGVGNIVQFPLQYLDVSANELTSFQVLGDVVGLNISGNKLTNLSYSLNSEYRVLILSHNEIETIKEDVFVKALNLTTLDLSGNLLRTLPTSQFSYLSKLSFIDVSDNLFRTQKDFGAYDNWVSLFHQCPELKYINLNKNSWNCKDLKDILLSSRASIQIVHGNCYNQTNILGIRCYESLPNDTLEPEKVHFNDVKFNRTIKDVSLKPNDIERRLNETPNSWTTNSTDLLLNVTVMKTKADLQNNLNQTSNVTSNLNSWYVTLLDVEKEIDRLDSGVTESNDDGTVPEMSNNHFLAANTFHNLLLSLLLVTVWGLIAYIVYKRLNNGRRHVIYDEVRMVNR